MRVHSESLACRLYDTRVPREHINGHLRVILLSLALIRKLAAERRYKCKKYVGHLRKVFPKVIEMNGGPTGY